MWSPLEIADVLLPFDTNRVNLGTILAELPDILFCFIDT
jgi:hypothetical protein